LQKMQVCVCGCIAEEDGGTERWVQLSEMAMAWGMAGWWLCGMVVGRWPCRQ
jgi:hypothetical protein